jgi:hypothetical protein
MDNIGKQQAEASIHAFQAAVINSEIEEVDEPTGRKKVEIAWEDTNGFHVKEGEAVGVFGDRINYYEIHWVDGEVTTVDIDDIVTFEESEYYTKEF